MTNGRRIIDKRAGNLLTKRRGISLQIKENLSARRRQGNSW
jgi:hypothetical protein